MAIYHFSAQIISRGAGRSAVAAAAYRAGETITNQWDGVTHDYTDKSWIKHKEILLPEHAPIHFKNRSALWNAVEQAEKSSNSQLAREINLALPIELNLEQQVELVREYVQIEFVQKGMCVDFVIHNPPVTDGEKRPIDKDGKPTNDYKEMVFQNPHAHLMATMRPLDLFGKWEPKSQKQYICRKENEEISIPSSLIKQAENKGFFKQYCFEVEGKKQWLTLAEGEAIGQKPLNYDPKSRAVPNPVMAEWNKKETLLLWRESWAEYCNEALKRNGFEVKVDHRSYGEQGINLVPTAHMGAQVFNMEKKGVSTELGDLNRRIQADNAFLQRMQREFDRMEEAAQAYSKQLATKLETIRAKHIIATYQEMLYSANIAKQQREIDAQIQVTTALQKNLEHLTAVIESLGKSLEAYERERERTNPLQLKKRKELEEKIISTESRIQELKKKRKELREKASNNIQISSKVSGLSAQEILKTERLQKDALRQEMAKLYQEFYTLVNDYKEDMSLLRELVQGKRKYYDRKIEEKLKEHYKDTIDKSILAKARARAPEIMNNDGTNLTKARSHIR